MTHNVIVQVGEKHLAVECPYLPQIGTRFGVHKHLTAGGVDVTVEVTAHRWSLGEEQEPGGLPVLSVWVETRLVAPAAAGIAYIDLP